MDSNKFYKRRGVVICGAYGMGNAGDEAILEAIVREMRGIDADMPICVLSRTPEETAARLGVRAIHTFNIFAFMRETRRAALYINGGGSLIQDVTSRRSLWYYLWTIRTAKRRGCPVMMYGCGIGPVLVAQDVDFTRRIVDKYVDVVTLREPDSLEELRRFGVTKPEMILASDPALILSPAPQEQVDEVFGQQGLDPQGQYICFALRRWPGFEEKAPAFAAAARHAYEALGLTPLFVSVNHKNDGDAAQKVIDLLGETPHESLPGPLPPELCIGVMRKMQLVVSMRLHGLIFAAGQAVPTVGVSYDPKVTAFLRCTGGGCVELPDVDDEGLCRLIDEAADLRSDTGALADRVRRMRELERLNTAAARRLLGKEEEK